jgi:hypothetical protein
MAMDQHPDPEVNAVAPNDTSSAGTANDSNPRDVIESEIFKAFRMAEENGQELDMNGGEEEDAEYDADMAYHLNRGNFDQKTNKDESREEVRSSWSSR